MIQEKIIEIIVYLLSELKNNKQLADIDLQNLSGMGYTRSEIYTAFSWIYSRINTGKTVFVSKKKTRKSHRFLHNIEKNIIEPDAFGYLIELKELGILNDKDVETMLEKIMLTGYAKVTLKDMKSIALEHILDSDNESRIIIKPDESIN